MKPPSSLRTSGDTVEAAKAAADLPNFLASGAAPVILTREHVIVELPPAA